MQDKLSRRIIIDHVVRHNSIVDYLEQKGHTPVRTMSNGRLSYNCPLPDHNEKRPSFVVFTNAEFENFYCFGCQRHANIIHLIMYMEGISFGESLSRLSHDIKITQADVSDRAINELVETESYKDVAQSRDTQLSSALLEVSNICRNQWEATGYDDKELKLIDSIYKCIDNDLLDCDFDDIKTQSENIRNILRERDFSFQE